ncbi:uncharacterized protein LOC106636669 [Copidosoma floridanum]|uniref:uncharacterized protein LOC106636669 n=1 Tax=Copidosoma floridanum TaxID=29053 RepID=UPI0006C9A643|nr:uncharacterized protein LOC106636669 [Copidosoma floridanum]
MGRKYKPRSIAEQDRKLCGGICICQFTIVISVVSFVYLFVAIYMPSHRAFKAGIETDPVMCQTVNTTLVNNCVWASCGEWCLTRTTGFCPQIHATVRRNGTDLIFDNCSRPATVSCPMVNPANAKRYNCNNGSECSQLSGTFECKLGHCSNLSELMLCHDKPDGQVVDAEKDNMKLNGNFRCVNSRCTRIKNPFTCDRYCPKITTTNVNVFIMQADNVVTASCSRAFALNKAHGNRPGERLREPRELWRKDKDAIVVSCFAAERQGDKIRTEDCVNGTLLASGRVPQPFINFTTFLMMYEQSLSRKVDPSDAYVPSQHSLTIYNSSRLYINLEGCVNTLRGECREFLVTHGADGDNQTAQSRYPCYYNKNNSFLVVARFDLEHTRTVLFYSIVVPVCMFFVSLTALIVITYSVRVGDDSKMHCTMCAGDDQPNESEGLVETRATSTPPQACPSVSVTAPENARLNPAGMAL